MLGLLGGIVGYALTYAAMVAVSRSWIPVSMPLNLSVVVDHRVTLFCIALSVLTGIAFGLVPAVRSTRKDLTSALKDEPIRLNRSSRLGLRNLLVVAQIAISMVLLICSGLFLRSLYTAGSVETGFAHRNLLMMSFDPALNGYTGIGTQRLLNAILDGARAVPGVESAALASSIPLNMEGTQNAVVPEDRMASEETNRIPADIYSVTPGFFDTFGIPMLAGEDFRASDSAGENTVIVNRALADRAFPQQNPIGRRIRYLGKTYRITGLVATAKSRSIGEDPRPCLYLPLAKDLQGNHSPTGVTLILRTKGDPAAYAPLIRQAVRTNDPALAVFDVRTMEEHLSKALFLQRTAAFLFGSAAFMGLFIATVGIYGVMSFTVAQRTKEIGVRIALGARQSQVVAMVLKHGLALTIAGAVIGLGAALAVSRVAASLLYGISPTDPLTFVLGPAILAAIALASCLPPALHAAALDPNRALKYE